MKELADRYHCLKAEILKKAGLEGKPEDYPFNAIISFTKEESLCVELKRLRDEICICLFNKVTERVRKTGRTCSFNADDIVSSTVKALISALDKYSPSQGDFHHYTNRIIKLQILSGWFKYRPLVDRMFSIDGDGFGGEPIEIPDMGIDVVKEIDGGRVRELIDRKAREKKMGLGLEFRVKVLTGGERWKGSTTR